MPADFVADGVDLDAIFAPYVSGVKADLTYLTVGGVDLKDRYQKYVSGPKADITFFTEGGVDLKDIFAPLGFDDLALTIDPYPEASTYDPTDGPGSASVGAEGIATGGTPAYSYLWTYVSGSTALIIDNATLAAPTWTFTSGSIASIRSAVWRCTVTDSVMDTATQTVTLRIQIGGEPP